MKVATTPQFDKWVGALGPAIARTRVRNWLIGYHTTYGDTSNKGSLPSIESWIEQLYAGKYKGIGVVSVGILKGLLRPKLDGFCFMCKAKIVPVDAYKMPMIDPAPNVKLVEDAWWTSAGVERSGKGYALICENCSKRLLFGLSGFTE